MAGAVRIWTGPVAAAAVTATASALVLAGGAASARSAAPHAVTRDTFRFVFAGSLGSVATYPLGGGTATDVWTTDVHWTVIYRVVFDIFPGGSVYPRAGRSCGFPLSPTAFLCRPAVGSGPTGTSVGVQNPGGPEVEPGCLEFTLAMRTGTYGPLTVIRPSDHPPSFRDPTIRIGVPSASSVTFDPSATHL